MTRRFKAYSRNKIGTLFEIFVPVILILIGLFFTQINFLSDAPNRPLNPTQLEGKQRIVVNADLIKTYGGIPGEIQESEDFDDDTDGWPSDLPIDISPLTIFSKMPGFDEGFYNIEAVNISAIIEADHIRAEEEEKEAERKRIENIELAKLDNERIMNKHTQDYEERNAKRRHLRYMSEARAILFRECRTGH